MSTFTQVWRCMWATDQQLKIWHSGGAPLITAEQLNKDIEAAYELGKKHGNGEGRTDLRRMIEQGEVPDLKVDETTQRDRRLEWDAAERPQPDLKVEKSYP